MGIYIKGVEMPRSCYDCKLDLRTDICSAFLKWRKEHPYGIKNFDRLPDCPLVEVLEPHGDLIDRQKRYQPEYKPVTLDDFPKTMSASDILNFEKRNRGALKQMQKMGFVVCKKTTSEIESAHKEEQ